MPQNRDWLTTPAAEFGDVRHRYLYHTDPTSDRLLVLLPGRGYTNEMPLLYGLRMVGVQHGWDTLSVTYGFHAQPEQEPGDLNAEVRDVLTHEGLKRDYRYVCLAGKSLGTPLAIRAAQLNLAEHTSFILLTPVVDSHAQVQGMPTLAIIGTADRAYSPELVESTRQSPNVQWKTVERADHSLEIPGDWRQSLQILTEVMADCEAFLQRQVSP